jgi:ribosomal-protein-alanine N-acetyltransferase
MHCIETLKIIGKGFMLDLSAAFAIFPVLETARLRLRAVQPDDVADVFRIRADERVMRYFGSPPITSLEEAARQIHGFATSFEERTGIRWAITWRGEDRLLGTLGFWRIDKPHFRAEVGYDLAADCWGQGIMAEALGAVLTWGFTTMHLHSVEAQIDPANHGSRRVLEKCGFVQEGYFRENYYCEGQFTDTAVFSLLGSVWLKHTNQ